MGRKGGLTCDFLCRDLLAAADSVLALTLQVVHQDPSVQFSCKALEKKARRPSLHPSRFQLPERLDLPQLWPEDEVVAVYTVLKLIPHDGGSTPDKQTIPFFDFHLPPNQSEKNVPSDTGAKKYGYVVFIQFKETCSRWCSFAFGFHLK